MISWRVIWYLVVAAITALWSYFSDVFWDLTQQFWDALLADITIDYAPDVPYEAEMLQMFSMANYWIPFGEGIALVAAYWVFGALFAALKFVIKLIPAVG